MSVLLEEALKLPVDERRQLADEIYDSVYSENERYELTPEQIAELERRIEHNQLHPEDTIQWEVVKSEALARK